VIIVDWSAASVPSPARPSSDAIWLGCADAATGTCTAQYHRTRASAETALNAAITSARQQGLRMLIGCDFPFGYPAGFASALTGQNEARGVWQVLAARIHDSPDNANNRFEVANAINAQFAAQYGGFGPFWGRPSARPLPYLPARKWVDYAALPFGERRQIETRLPSAQPVWKLFTTGSVGSQSLMGLPMIARLAQIEGVGVWPFDSAPCQVTLAEVYPSLLAPQVSAAMAMQSAPIKDEVQVRLLARAFMGQSDSIWPAILAQPDPLAPEEGWILGAQFAAELAAAL